MEVASPSQRRKELAAKARVWLDAGVRLVWLVLPDTEKIEVYQAGHADPVQVLDASGRLDGGDVLRGFSYELAQLWKA